MRSTGQGRSGQPGPLFVLRFLSLIVAGHLNMSDAKLNADVISANALSNSSFLATMGAENQGLITGLAERVKASKGTVIQAAGTHFQPFLHHSAILSPYLYVLPSSCQFKTSPQADIAQETRLTRLRSLCVVPLPPVLDL